ncbi:putative protein-L-isoaspartate O-methyltransferase [Rosellinia necatrix]|uniref:protein-L-isoaspartate(D-aspartate) O-methyltransferase n=1 Tax=Rosellinia necatrix TaxID=77044 RepID=A0A1W2TXP1_ROSNE|nr:putative protein-L-isoaspartate O-methyltransferase [Rosellinia necatrix]
MAWRSSGTSNASLVENLWSNGMIRQEAVKAAFLKVDRANYAPSSPYEDSPQSIGHRATISAPHMHASAVESLLPHVLPGGGGRRPRRILDIGSGSGYLTHILAELAGEDAVVVGVEHIEALQALGIANMSKSPEGRHLLSSGRVRFRVGDGRKGWVEPEPEAPSGTSGQPNVDVVVSGAADESDAQGWDAIHVGAAAVELHPELLDQLRKPGRMFIPVEEGGVGARQQYIWVVDKEESGTVRKERMYGVRYVPLTDAPRP